MANTDSNFRSAVENCHGFCHVLCRSWWKDNSRDCWNILHGASIALIKYDMPASDELEFLRDLRMNQRDVYKEYDQEEGEENE